ncbi:MAG: SWIM zinc finger family protein [Bacillaceae bacterium]|nr:SWIM zinc finger family protein [Bacillaceae bacterium]
MINKSDSSYTAIVHGNNDYIVEVDLEELEYAFCNCPYDDWCKHIVAVLLEIKQNETRKNESIISGDFDTTNPSDTLKKLKGELKPYCLKFYDILTLNFPLRKQRLVHLVEQLYGEIHSTKTNNHDQLYLLAFVVIIDELTAKLAKHSPNQNIQMETLFKQLLNLSLLPIEREKNKKEEPFHSFFSEIVLKKSTKGRAIHFYRQILEAWLAAEQLPDELLKHSKELLSFTKVDELFFSRLASFLYLKANEGAKSLVLLKKIKPLTREEDLVEHFRFMKQRNDWEMMKHWFQLLLPKPERNTELKTIYHDMIVETGSKEERLTIVWNEWLTDPRFSTYATKIAKINKDEKEDVLAYILPNLEQHLLKLPIEATYFKVVRAERQFERGMNVLLNYKKDPTTLTSEIEQFLTEVMRHNEVLLLPFITNDREVSY